MGDEHLGVGGDLLLLAGKGILHEEGHAVELDALDGDGGVTEVVAVGVEAAKCGAVEAIVVVAGDENLVAIR